MTSWSGAACRFLGPALSAWEEGFLTDIERLLRSHDGRVTLTDKQFDRVFLIFEKLDALESPTIKYLAFQLSLAVALFSAPSGKSLRKEPFVQSKQAAFRLWSSR